MSAALDSLTLTGSGSDVVRGRTEPRLWTPPLRELTPETSYGFDVIDFARDVLDHPLDPWQEWVVIHAGELLPDGRPRFRHVLCLVARQNGKTELLVVLTLYWLYVEQVDVVLGTSTKLQYAVESWEKALKLAQRVPDLAAEIPKKGGIRRANGETALKLSTGGRYMVAASNEEGGRSLTIDRLILDELRQHHSYVAWDAAEPAASRPDSQVWAITNAGGDRSVVLNDLRQSALDYIATGQGDRRLGLFEYSAPDGSSPLDPDALAQANPNLGYRKDIDALVGKAGRAMQLGGEVLAGFKTEEMCMRVPLLDPAISPEEWAACHEPGTLKTAARSSSVALCADVSIDAQHATLVAAAVQPDGRVRVAVVAAWSGQGCTQQLRRELPGWVTKLRPKAVGWFPAGPAAAVAADMADRKGRQGWPPRGVRIEEIRGEVAAVCMGFADLVTNGQIVHPGDPLLDAHVAGAEKLRQGDAWRFTRKGAGHCDATYAAAGAAHLARTMPSSTQPPRVIAAKA
jgi:hypothetical protein